MLGKELETDSELCLGCGFAGGGEVFTKKTRTWMSQEVGKWLVNGL